MPLTGGATSGATEVAVTAGDRAGHRELEALVSSRGREEACRWVGMSGFGLIAIAVSCVSWWWVARAPIAVVAGTSPPLLVAVGLAAAVVAMAARVRWPERWPGAACLVVLIGTLVVAVGGIIAAAHDAPGSGPWLALCGALVTATSAVAGLIPAGAGRHDGSSPRVAPGSDAAHAAHAAHAVGGADGVDRGDGGEDRGSLASWAALRARAERLPPPWGVGDRLAVVSLAALLVGVALPWGDGRYAHPLALPQADSPWLLLAATVVASVLVAASVVWRAAFATVGRHVMVLVAGFAAVAGSLGVRLDVEDPLPVVVPGRVAVLVGGLALMLASALRARQARGRAVLLEAQLFAFRRDEEQTARRNVEELLGGVTSPVGRRAGQRAGQGAWAGAALALVVAGSVALTGAWWRPSFRLHGPGAWVWDDFGEASGALVEAGRSADIVRSGIDVAGVPAAWAVAVVTGIAVVTAVVGGARRAALASAAAAAVLTTVAVTALAEQTAGGTVVPWLTAVAGVVAVALGGRRWWSSASRGWRYLVVPLVVAGLSATVVVDRPEDPPPPRTDGPYRVLVGGDAGRDGSDSLSLLGGPAAQVTADRAMWSHGEPTFLTDTDASVTSWVVRDGRAEVRGVADGVTVHALFREATATGSTDGTVLVQDATGSDVPALWTRGSAPQPLPADTLAASLGPDGRVWMVTDPVIAGPRLRVATVEELSAAAAASSTIDEWPAVPFDESDVWTIHATDDAALAVVANVDQSKLVLVRPDGSARTVLGGTLDRRCGLNRQATGSYLDHGSIEIDVEGSALPDTEPLLPLDAAVPTADGGAWLVLPASSPAGNRVHALGRIDPDGTVRRVDHALPPLESLAPSPDGDAVLVVERDGRVLELTDAGRHAEPLPPTPPGCDPEAPTVAPPG